MPRIVNLANAQQFAAINLLVDPGHDPGPVIIPNCARVRLNWQLPDGKVGHNVLYAQWAGTPLLTPAVAETIRTGIVAGTAWTNVALAIHPTASFLGVTLLDVRSSTGIEINSTGPATPGTATGTAMPDEVAVCITLRTATRGPSGRGRFYVPGLSGSTMAAGGVIVAGTVTAFSTWADSNVRGAITSAIGPLCLGLPHRNAYTSDRTGRDFAERAATTVPVTQALCRDNHYDSQRRRGLR
jgi:hypothetical protein